MTATPDYWSQTSGAIDLAAVSGNVTTKPFYSNSISTFSSGTIVNAVPLGSGFGLTNSIGAQATGGTGGGIAADVFNANPESVPPAGTPTHYFDVRTSTGSTWTSVEVSDCAVATGQKLYYWTASLGACPRQSATGGCITDTLNSSSTPALSTLAGAGVVFADAATPTQTKLVPSATSVVYGKNLKLTATVTASDSTIPTGSVTFKNGSTTLGTESLTSGSAVLNTTALKPASYSLTAIFTPTAHNGYGASTSSIESVTVNKAPLDVTLKVTVPYTTAPVVTNVAASSTEILYSGFVGTDKSSVVSGKLSCKTTATSTSAPGSYQITNCSGLSAANYTITYKTGSVTVTMVGTKLTYNGASATGAKNSFKTTTGVTRKKAAYFEATLDTVTGKTVSGRKGHLQTWQWPHRPDLHRHDHQHWSGDLQDQQRNRS